MKILSATVDDSIVARNYKGTVTVFSDGQTFTGVAEGSSPKEALQAALSESLEQHAAPLRKALQVSFKVEF